MKPQCQKLSKFSGYRPTDRLTDKPTPKNSKPELNHSPDLTKQIKKDIHYLVAALVSIQLCCMVKLLETSMSAFLLKMKNLENLCNYEENSGN